MYIIHFRMCVRNKEGNKRKSINTFKKKKKKRRNILLYIQYTGILRKIAVIIRAVTYPADKIVP